MITYTFIDNIFYKEGKRISKSKVQQEIPKYAFNNLTIKGKCRVKSIKNSSSPLGEYIENKGSNKIIIDDKLYNKHKGEYKISMQPFHGKQKMGIERKNKKYGYWNFIAYIDSEEDFKDVVIKDIKAQMNADKQKNKSIEDDDI